MEKIGKKPVIFLSVLVIILVFLIGFRAGQNVERINKNIDFILSLTPSISPSPTPSPTPLTKEEFVIKRTGFKLIFPSNLEIEEGTKPGELVIKEKKQATSPSKIK